MRVLVIGNGAREHAIVWKLAQSCKIKELFAAPGNAGTSSIAENISIRVSDFKTLAKIVQQKKIDTVVVGPEIPLSEGIVDYLESLGIPVFGPSKLASEIESSKVFSKGLMNKYGITCAKAVIFKDYDQAKDYIKKQTPPIVIRADGLAAGKGVVIAQSLEEAWATLRDFMEVKILGASGNQVLIEEFLCGREMSSFVFTDGITVLPFISACDYKRINNNDLGPNTGGMGSYSPPVYGTTALYKKVQDTVMSPIIKAMAREGRPYRGILYGGLMIKKDDVKVIEFNCRLGDPESQVILPRLKTDLLDIIMAVIKGKLNQITVEVSEEACVGVVMASGGYPGEYKTGFPITGLQNLDKDIMVFHAGTKVGNTPYEIITNGGRVLTISAMGKTIAEAREKVYDNISRIHFEGAHYRKDIAFFKS